MPHAKDLFPPSKGGSGTGDQSRLQLPSTSQSYPSRHNIKAITTEDLHEKLLDRVEVPMTALDYVVNASTFFLSIAALVGTLQSPTVP